MEFFVVEPEVAGSLGPRTIFDRSFAKPRVARLHHVFDGWLGDELIECTPAFLMTERLTARLVEFRFRGTKCRSCEVETSDQFRELHSATQLPRFLWVQVVGQPLVDDFFLLEDERLGVSGRAWDVVRGFAPNALVSKLPK